MQPDMQLCMPPPRVAKLASMMAPSRPITSAAGGLPARRFLYGKVLREAALATARDVPLAMRRGALKVTPCLFLERLPELLFALRHPRRGKLLAGIDDNELEPLATHHGSQSTPRGVTCRVAVVAIGAGN